MDLKSRILLIGIISIRIWVLVLGSETHDSDSSSSEDESQETGHSPCQSTVKCDNCVYEILHTCAFATKYFGEPCFTPAPTGVNTTGSKTYVTFDCGKCYSMKMNFTLPSGSPCLFPNATLTVVAVNSKADLAGLCHTLSVVPLGKTCCSPNVCSLFFNFVIPCNNSTIFEIYTLLFQVYSGAIPSTLQNCFFTLILGTEKVYAQNTSINNITAVNEVSCPAKSNSESSSEDHESTNCKTSVIDPSGESFFKQTRRQKHNYML